MPLAPGSDQATISKNISELSHHGSRPRSHAQIVAIALSNADRHPHAAAGGIGGMGGLSKVGIAAFHPSRTSAPASRMMSPSEATPWWTRSSERQMAAPIHMGRFADGGIAHMAVGGMMPASEASPWFERSDARVMDVPFHGGLIGGSGAGRTDQIPLAVGGDSHVLSADVVSGLGQGSTLAGARILDAALKSAPFGVPFPHAVHGRGPPAPPHVSMAANDPGPTGIARTMETGLAEGGREHKKTSILAASGEYVVPREDVLALGRRIQAKDAKKHNMDAMSLGHEALDDLIARVRRFNINWLRSAPPPKK